MVFLSSKETIITRLTNEENYQTDLYRLVQGHAVSGANLKINRCRLHPAKVRGFLHLYNGQEAILAGALHAMELGKDRMITAYRNHVQPIGMGVDPKRYGRIIWKSHRNF